MDSFRKFRCSDNLEYYQEWIKKVSDDHDVKVSDVNYSYIIENYPNANISSIAWAHPYEKLIFMNYNEMEKGDYLVRTVKATLLHEYGHIFYNRSRKYKNFGGNIYGFAGWEYLAHVWAMNKASKLGLENELKVLRYMFEDWRKETKRNYRIAHRMLRNIGI